MNHLLRYLWFALLVRPLVLVVMGMNVRHRERLVDATQSIIVANHNSHLDTMVLLSLLPLKRLRTVRPVAAADYFLRTRLLTWFATRIIGIVPIRRDPAGHRHDPLAGCSEAIENGETLVLFPEGTRGEPERLQSFKNGVAHLAKRHPHVPVIPVFMHGLGKALPKGEVVLVPFCCDVIVGDPLLWGGSRSEFMEQLELAMKELAAQVACSPWE